MLQASVTYNTTEYSNSTIENVSAPLSGKYGQVNPDQSAFKFEFKSFTITDYIFSPSFAQLVSVLSYQKIQN